MKKKTFKKTKVKSPVNGIPAVRRKKRPAPVFPIVGIGASAGGLEALELFFASVPAGCPFAFVVIQHLDPTHKSIMGSLLAKYTAMNIAEISDGMSIEKSRVYLGPPDRNIAIIDNTLHHITPEKEHGLNLPIDYFFKSLAVDRGRRSIGIILSGTGTDGTLGLKAIKEAGGMAMVQKEAQAKYPGMPKSAIDTGLIDFVLPVEKMPQRLIEYSRHPYLKTHAVAEPVEGNLQTDIQKILILIRAKTGHDFSLYKASTIRRRIERRMALHQMERTADYVRYLDTYPNEVELLFKEILINVTRFFRDTEAFAALDKKGIPYLLENKKRDDAVRIWVPGCSTGEEAYSLAIALTEAMEKAKKHCAVQVFASDIDAEAIETGRRAVYPESVASDISKRRLDRFFTKDGDSYRVKKQIRECVVFALQDVAKDPPFSKLDLISCRNMLIYMDQTLQKKILPLFHYSLVDRGVLFLGSSESIGELSGSFSALDTKWKIYKKKGISHGVARRPVSPGPLPIMEPNYPAPGAETGYRSLGEKVILRSFAPPSALVNEQFDIVYCYGPIDRFLALPSGAASLNILRIAREELRGKLAPALSEALKRGVGVIVENVRTACDGEERTIDLVVQPIVEPAEKQRLLLIVFREKSDVEAPVKKTRAQSASAGATAEIAALRRELHATKDRLQNAIEQLQTANEEFQSANEELQSANEELETSKEELQSTNEELVTVNSELQHKVDQLTETGNDVNNLLASTEIASVFLDTELRIKRFTPATVKIFRLIQTDIGRSIRDITSNIASFDFYAAAGGVLATLERREAEVRSEEGRLFTLRIIPYRTMDNAIEGVVITLIDISDIKGPKRSIGEMTKIQS